MWRRQLTRKISLGKILFLFFKIVQPSLEAIEVTKMMPQTEILFFFPNGGNEAEKGAEKDQWFKQIDF